MNIKVLITFIIISIFGNGQTWALTEFPAGICTLQGFLEKSPIDDGWIFSVNYGSNSETTFKLLNFRPDKSLFPSGQYIELIIKIPNKTLSAIGQAEYVSTNKLVNPYSSITEYHTLSQTKKVCAALK